MPRPSKIVCIGRNYREHASELGNDVPTTPFVFLKPPSAVIASGETIVLPAGVGRVDFEGEIGIVVGATMRKVTAAQAATMIRGIVAVNDVSARELQKSDPQWWRAKGFDTFCPIGPERAGTLDLRDLTVVTRVNGVELQRGHSSEMVFPIADLLSYVSQALTLEPGDVLATGTPSGVRALVPGDEVDVEVLGWSRVTNRVVAE
jgi:2-keto-4-pentenoate hydratase/2-oxohepta-3-ene-1,7-dioic acid hydratase in catechol pathway